MDKPKKPTPKTRSRIIRNYADITHIPRPFFKREKKSFIKKIMCFIGLHDFKTIANFNDGEFEYKACQRCHKRIVINDYLSKNGRKYASNRNIFADDDYLKGKTIYPRTTKQIIGPKPKVK